MVFRPMGFALRGWPKPIIFVTFAVHERVTRSPKAESPFPCQARAVFARETIRESGGRCEFHAGFGRNAGAGRRERLRQNDAGPRDCASHRVGYGQRIVRWRRHHPTGWGAVASAAAETADDFSRPVWLLEPAHDRRRGRRRSNRYSQTGGQPGGPPTTDRRVADIGWPRPHSRATLPARDQRRPAS